MTTADPGESPATPMPSLLFDASRERARKGSFFRAKNIEIPTFLRVSYCNFTRIVYNIIR